MREMRERDWFWLDNALVDRYDLNIYEKMLYVCLARHIGSNDYAYPKLETLAKELGIKDTRTIVKHTKSLEQKGLITVERLKGKANRYYLNNVKVDTSNVPTLDDTTLNVPTSDVPPVPTSNVPTSTYIPCGSKNIHKEDTIKNKEREKEAEPDPVSNSGGYYQEIRMLLASYKINYEKIARLGKPISRIKEVLRIAKENGKSEGWIVGALTDDYNLVYFYKPREIKKEAAKKKSGKVIDSSEYEDFSGDYFEKYIGKGEEIA